MKNPDPGINLKRVKACATCIEEELHRLQCPPPKGSRTAFRHFLEAHLGSLALAESIETRQLVMAPFVEESQPVE